ncbi:DMP19 family protein [Nocardia thailandica]
MDYRFPAPARAELTQALATTDSLREAADTVFWANPATDDLRGAGDQVFADLPPAFAHLLALTTLRAEVLDGGFGRYLRRHPRELPWATRGLRAAGMPELAAAAVIAGYEVLGDDGADLDGFFDDERAVLSAPDQIRRPSGSRCDDTDELYDVNEPEDFEERVLDYVRANLDHFVRHG